MQVRFFCRSKHEVDERSSKSASFLLRRRIAFVFRCVPFLSRTWSWSGSRDPFLDCGALMLSFQRVNRGISSLMYWLIFEGMKNYPNGDVFVVLWPFKFWWIKWQHRGISTRYRHGYNARLIGNPMMPLSVILQVASAVWNLYKFHVWLYFVDHVLLIICIVYVRNRLTYAAVHRSSSYCFQWQSWPFDTDKSQRVSVFHCIQWFLGLMYFIYA